MSSKPAWQLLIPRIEVPALPPMNGRERLALLIGTCFGCGFMKPAAPSWASIPGFFYFIAVSRLPTPAAVAIFALVLVPAIWSGTICERLLARKDPRPVVIDEIAAVPFALWPLWLHWPVHLSTWIILFVIYRFSDFIKPWPANSLQSVKGGLGILIDDVISSIYASLPLWFCVLHFPAMI